MIKGYDDLITGRAKELSGIVTPDDRTVVFTLTRPDATFLHLHGDQFRPMSCRRKRSRKAGADWGKKPVGTGAFKFVEWVPGQRIVLERNTDYFRQGIPYLDKLTFEFGQDPTVAVLRLRRGRGRHRRRRHPAGAIRRRSWPIRPTRT